LVASSEAATRAQLSRDYVAVDDLDRPFDLVGRRRMVTITLIDGPQFDP
jgi:hypothetical protein